MKPLAWPALQVQHTLKPTPPSAMKHKHQHMPRAVKAKVSKGPQVDNQPIHALQFIQALIMALLFGVLTACGGGGGASAPPLSVRTALANGGTLLQLAGNASGLGSADTISSEARFNLPYRVAVDGSGNVYVADSTNHTIRKITSAGVVTK
jgi:DNA-binding beta-propeller fold protein YncE